MSDLGNGDSRKCALIHIQCIGLQILKINLDKGSLPNLKSKFECDAKVVYIYTT